eukprot:5324830-Pleurochrysis_carterae.AAC.2
MAASPAEAAPRISHYTSGRVYATSECTAFGQQCVLTTTLLELSTRQALPEYDYYNDMEGPHTSAKTPAEPSRTR